MNFAAPRIEEIATIEFRLAPAPWPFASNRAQEIDAHWARLVRRNPHHYNGRVLLMRDVNVVATASGRRLEGRCFVAEYKAFLAWRDFGFPDASVSNVFAMAALRSAEGAFLLGEMGPTTANAGQIYFPAGTPEPDDLVGGRIDLEACVRRELREETGIGVDEVSFDTDWRAVLPRAAHSLHEDGAFGLLGEGPRGACGGVHRRRETTGARPPDRGLRHRRSRQEPHARFHSSLSPPRSAG